MSLALQRRSTRHGGNDGIGDNDFPNKIIRHPKKQTVPSSHDIGSSPPGLQKRKPPLSHSQNNSHRVGKDIRGQIGADIVDADSDYDELHLDRYSSRPKHRPPLEEQPSPKEANRQRNTTQAFSRASFTGPQPRASRSQVDLRNIIPGHPAPPAQAKKAIDPAASTAGPLTRRRKRILDEPPSHSPPSRSPATRGEPSSWLSRDVGVIEIDMDSDEDSSSPTQSPGASNASHGLQAPILPAPLFTIHNIGNSCYINSMLQVLLHTPLLFTMLLKRYLLRLDLSQLAQVLVTWTTSTPPWGRSVPSLLSQLQHGVTIGLDLRQRSSLSSIFPAIWCSNTPITHGGRTSGPRKSLQRGGPPLPGPSPGAEPEQSLSDLLLLMTLRTHIYQFDWDHCVAGIDRVLGCQDAQPTRASQSDSDSDHSDDDDPLDIARLIQPQSPHIIKDLDTSWGDDHTIPRAHARQTPRGAAMAALNLDSAAESADNGTNDRPPHSHTQHYTPSSFINFLSHFRDDFNGYIQHDVHELFSQLLQLHSAETTTAIDSRLSHLTNELKKELDQYIRLNRKPSIGRPKKKPPSDSFRIQTSHLADDGLGELGALFNGESQTSSTCYRCGHHRTTYEPFNTLTAYIPSQSKPSRVAPLSPGTLTSPLHHRQTHTMSSRLEIHERERKRYLESNSQLSSSLLSPHTPPNRSLSGSSLHTPTPYSLTPRQRKEDHGTRSSHRTFPSPSLTPSPLLSNSTAIHTPPKTKAKTQPGAGQGGHSHSSYQPRSLHINDLLAANFTTYEVNVICDNCQYGFSRSTMTLSKLPPMLCIQINRVSNPLSAQKTNKVVTFEPLLDVGPWKSPASAHDGTHPPSCTPNAATSSPSAAGSEGESDNDSDLFSRDSDEDPSISSSQEDDEVDDHGQPIHAHMRQLIESLGIQMTTEPARDNSAIRHPPSSSGPGSSQYHLHSVISHHGSSHNSGHYFVDLNLGLVRQATRCLSTLPSSLPHQHTSGVDDVLNSINQTIHNSITPNPGYFHALGPNEPPLVQPLSNPPAASSSTPYHHTPPDPQQPDMAPPKKKGRPRKIPDLGTGARPLGSSEQAEHSSKPEGGDQLWARLDDTSGTYISQSKVLSNKVRAYLLFYINQDYLTPNK